MKLRTLRYIVKEGLLNVFRNKLMFVACSAILATALIILGIFMLLILNIESNIEMLNEIPQIQVYCRYDLSDEEVAAFEYTLRDEPGITEFTTVTRHEAFIKAKALLEENGDILEGFEDDFLPASFIIRMDNPDFIEEFVQKIEELDEVDKVFYPKKAIDFISSHLWTWDEINNKSTDNPFGFTFFDRYSFEYLTGPYIYFDFYGEDSLDLEKIDFKKLISLPDMVINNWWSDELEEMDTYFNDFDTPNTALNRWGKTIIPPKSIDKFIEIINTKTDPNYLKEYKDEFQALISLLQKAKQENKFVIHYGV